ncbi:LacI family DNA-binding transcriptional regulator [Bifidobacterium amazonense]|uniref:LacI family DNA-binding transcriptional regulator n=1 Tax=Bifidobacterium amazonense TaxID=2809027 RepID=A0ABS9VWW1_9BIFI|nr:LacI family DNA-binding transcriptional regulator [Bifidobacterium amazonense]MCH9276401.1 LacI family DNA-binding transcriptional regulator [Bifidobacterium amazonense]
MARRRSTDTKPASIKDVAALAGVSVPTVSRYLNDRGVSDEKRTRIARAIDMLGYRPNPIAQALVNERTSMIAVMCADITLFGQAQTYKGIEQRAHGGGYSPDVFVLGGRDVAHEVRSCLDRNPAGLILMNFDPECADVLDLVPHDLPTAVIAGNRDERFAQISLAEDDGGYRITRHLLELGHRSVQYIGIPGGVGSYSRMAGWQRACREAGIVAPDPIACTWRPQDARAIGRRLADDPAVTAVFAGNDETAMGVIRGLRDGGRRVPDDVSVVGFDDHPLASIWDPAITTIRQDFHRAGAAAFDAVTGIIADLGEGRVDSRTQLVEVPGELVIRQSSGPAAR